MGRILDAFRVLIGSKAAEDLGRETGEIVRQLTRRSLPPARGKKGVLQAFHDHPVLRMAVSRIAWDIADVQWHVQRGEEKLDEHAALSALRMPNDRQSGMVFRMVTEAYLDTVGEAPWLALPSDYNDSGFEFLTIPPTAIKGDKDRQGNLEWRVRLGDLEAVFPDDNVIWLKYPDLLNPFGRGRGTGGALVDELEIEDYATEHLKSELFNHARPDMQIHVSGAKSDEIERIKTKWHEEHGGPQNAGKVMFTGAQDPEGTMEAVELSRSVADTKLLDVRDGGKELVRQTYNIPPEIMGDSKDANRATIDAAYYLYSKGVLKRRLGFFAAEVEMKLWPLLPPSSQRGRLGHEKVVPDDKQFRLEVMKTFPSTFEKNEARTLADKEPRDEFDGEFLSAPQPAGPAVPPGGDDGSSDEDGEEKAVLPLRTKSNEDDAERVANEAVPEDGGPEAEMVATEYQAAMAAFAASAIEDLDADISLDDLEPEVREQVERRMEEIWRDKIDDVTRDSLKQTILDGLDEGKNPLKAKADLNDTFNDMKASRRETIARTEMGSAQGAGQDATYKKSPSVEYKAWLHSYLGPHGRENHEDLENETAKSPIPVNKKFWTRGKSADHPCGFGDPEEDANCTCSLLAAFPDDEDKGYTPEQRDELRFQRHKELTERERDFAQVVDDYFEAQRERAIDAFERIIEGPA